MLASRNYFINKIAKFNENFAENMATDNPHLWLCLLSSVWQAATVAADDVCLFICELVVDVLTLAATLSVVLFCLPSLIPFEWWPFTKLLLTWKKSGFNVVKITLVEGKGAYLYGALDKQQETGMNYNMDFCWSVVALCRQTLISHPAIIR